MTRKARRHTPKNPLLLLVLSAAKRLRQRSPKPWQQTSWRPIEPYVPNAYTRTVMAWQSPSSFQKLLQERIRLHWPELAIGLDDGLSNTLRSGNIEQS